MKKASVVFILFIISSLSAFSLHEVELKDGKYFYGIIDEVFDSYIVFRSVDLQKYYEIDKINIADMKEINAEVHLLNGEDYICTVNFAGDNYVLKNSFIDMKVPADEVIFIEFNDKSEKVKEKKEKAMDDLADPEAKYYYNRVGAGIG